MLIIRAKLTSVRNTALYVSSRTLYALARSSDVRWFKKTVGRTSSEGTPLVAIGLSFMFAFLAFLAQVNVDNGSDVSLTSLKVSFT
jgi:amino acid permease